MAMSTHPDTVVLEPVTAAETLGLEEAARLLRMSPSFLRKSAAAGKVPGAKIGRRWVFVKSDLIELIRNQARKRSASVLDVAKLRFDPGYGVDKGASKLAREISNKRRNLKPRQC
jgi:excisionase family DNA binding protein